MSLLRYIELKSGFNDNGPAWIGRVAFSRSKTTIYFNGRALKRSAKSRDYFDIVSGETFWVSGIKKNGENRHWAGSGPIFIDSVVVPEYLALRNLKTLNKSQFKITDDIIQTDIREFHEIENSNV